VISGEGGPTTGSTGVAQRIGTTGLLRQFEKEEKKIF